MPVLSSPKKRKCPPCDCLQCGLTDLLFVCSGCAVVGSKDAAQAAIEGGSTPFNVVTPELLTGRKYLVVRAIDDASPGQDAQKHIINEFYSCVDEWDP